MPTHSKEKVGNGVVFTLSSSITNDLGSDKVTVTLPYEKPADKMLVKVYWLKDDGSMEEFEAGYADGFVTFQTTHFSDWVVRSDNPDTIDITVDGVKRSVAFGSVFKDVVSQPVRDGYTFAGWYGDSACTVSFDTSAVIDPEGVEVFSKFTKNAEPEPQPEPEPESSGGKGGMCGSAIAAIVVSMCAVLAIPVIRYVRP